MAVGSNIPWMDEIHFSPFRTPVNEMIPCKLPTNGPYGFNHGVLNSAKYILQPSTVDTLKYLVLANGKE